MTQKEIYHKYYLSHKDKILKYTKEYRKKNPEKCRKAAREYYRRTYKKKEKIIRDKICTECGKGFRTVTSLKKRCSAKCNLEFHNTYVKSRHASCKKTWNNYFPEKTICGVCGKKIFFKADLIKNTIHFDHRIENCIIAKKPDTWLRTHKRTPENEKIWESCNFGILCHWCNLYLPTKNRKEWLAKVIKYVNQV